MKFWIDMSMNSEEVAAWWDEFERELAKMTVPCVPMPPPIPEKGFHQPKWVVGNTYYTLKDDMQFAVDASHPDSVGWNYE